MALSNSVILDVASGIAAGVTASEHHGDYALRVPRESIIDVLTELRDNPRTGFDQCVDITVVDWATSPDRYEVVYLLYSIENAARVTVTTMLRADRPHVASAVGVWEGANWYEREAYDMYGVIFEGHPDLRRFFMPEDFMDEDGEPLYPLRKDFPLMGIPGSLPLPDKLGSTNVNK